jgi:hypothetical protein
LVARRTEDAVDALLTRLRRTAGCITDQPIIAPATRESRERREAVFVPRAEPVRLRTESGNRIVLFQIGIDLVVSQTGRPTDDYDITIASYLYRILDREEREILAFHWHPTGLSNVTDPHLHLSSRLNPIDMGRNQEPLPLVGMHIPTGFVTLEDVVRLLTIEFGITPHRDDWDALLRENRSIALAEQGR